MSDFKVEKGIPFPRVRLRYPFREMKVGDSFFMPCADEEKRRIARRLSSTTSNPKNGGRFTVRRVEGGVRVWKIEEENDA